MVRNPLIAALIALSLLWGLNASASAAVTVDATTGTIQDGTASPFNWSFTMGTVSNGALEVVLVFATSTLPTGLAVTFNSVAMTQITGTNTGTNGACSCSTVTYGLLAPASGAHTISVTWTGGAAEAHGSAISFAGVSQTSIATAFPNGAFTQFTTAVAPHTLAVTSAAGDLVVAVDTQETSFPWGTINGTIIADSPCTGPQNCSAANYNSGAATVTASFAFGSASIGNISGNDVAAAGGGGGSTAKPRLLELMGAGR